MNNYENLQCRHFDTHTATRVSSSALYFNWVIGKETACLILEHLCTSSLEREIHENSLYASCFVINYIFIIIFLLMLRLNCVRKRDVGKGGTTRWSELKLYVKLVFRSLKKVCVCVWGGGGGGKCLLRFIVLALLKF